MNLFPYIMKAFVPYIMLNERPPRANTATKADSRILLAPKLGFQLSQHAFLTICLQVVQEGVGDQGLAFAPRPEQEPVGIDVEILHF